MGSAVTWPLMESLSQFNCIVYIQRANHIFVNHSIIFELPDVIFSGATGHVQLSPHPRLDSEAAKIQFFRRVNYSLSLWKAEGRVENKTRHLEAQLLVDADGRVGDWIDEAVDEEAEAARRKNGLSKSGRHRVVTIEEPPFVQIRDGCRPCLKCGTGKFDNRPTMRHHHFCIVHPDFF